MKSNGKLAAKLAAPAKKQTEKPAASDKQQTEKPAKPYSPSASHCFIHIAQFWGSNKKMICL